MALNHSYVRMKTGIRTARNPVECRGSYGLQWVASTPLSPRSTNPMARTPSTMLPLGTPMPEFDLLDVRTGATFDSAWLAEAPASIVAFWCNHCPFVLHIAEAFVEFANEAMARGVPVVAISANDVDAYPQDAPDAMAALAERSGYGFPYLFDESQEVAKAFAAACTPDLYLFDADGRLVYRGQFDDSRPGNGRPVTGRDLRDALDQVLAGQPVSADQQPSIGCNIKWSPGNAPAYYG